MNAVFRIPLSFTAFLVMVSFILEPTGLKGQQRSAADTIAYLIKTQKKPTLLCDNLYALGNYYWNTGDVDNAQLAMDKCKELAEKYHYEKGVYDAYAILGALSLRRGDVTQATLISDQC